MGLGLSCYRDKSSIGAQGGGKERSQLQKQGQRQRLSSPNSAKCSPEARRKDREPKESSMKSSLEEKSDCWDQNTRFGVSSNSGNEVGSQR